MQTYQAEHPIGELVPHPANPNQGDVGAIHESIETNGWYGAVIAQHSTRYILAGHHRIIAAQHSDMQSVPVILLDCDDATALRILLGDNRIAALAATNSEHLAETLTQLAATGDLAGTGYDTADLDELLTQLTQDPLPVAAKTVTCPECGHQWAGK